jgi:NAD(P)-dependent dehydrogenase (short-subunit alcohol dehydrogenase family)
MGPRAAVAVVTGAANGIGRAVALRLRDDGFAVAAADIEPAEPAGGILPCPLDVADIDQHDQVLERVEAELGPLSALVNVAGVFLPEKLEQLTPDAWRRQHAVMLDGPVWLARSAGLRMAARGSGRIVNATSVHASNGETASRRILRVGLADSRAAAGRYRCDLLAVSRARIGWRRGSGPVGVRAAQEGRVRPARARGRSVGRRGGAQRDRRGDLDDVLEAAGRER